MTDTSLPAGFFRPIEFAGRLLGGGAVPAICIPLVARDRVALQGELQAVLALAPDIIEWRVDHFLTTHGADDVPGVLQQLRSVLEASVPSARPPLIFTLRSPAEGGEACGLDAERAAGVIDGTIASGAIDFIDLELSASPGLFSQALMAARKAGIRSIVSSHDFSATPPTDEIFDRLRRAVQVGADIAKVAVMPRSMADVLRLLEASERGYRELERPLITMAMGPLGGVSRVFCGMFGSSLSFAAGSATSAPGQWPAESLRAAFELIRSRSLPR